MSNFDKEYYIELGKKLNIIIKIKKESKEENDNENLVLYQNIKNIIEAACLKIILPFGIKENKKDIIKMLEEKKEKITDKLNFLNGTISDFSLVKNEQKTLINERENLNNTLKIIENYSEDDLINEIIYSLIGDINILEKNKTNIINTAKYMISKISYEGQLLIDEEGKINYPLIRKLEMDIKSTNIMLERNNILNSMSTEKTYRQILDVKSYEEIVVYKHIYTVFKELYKKEEKKIIKKINSKLRYKKYRQCIKLSKNGKYIIMPEQLKDRLEKSIIKNAYLSEKADLIIYYKNVMKFVKSVLEKDGIQVEKKQKCYQNFLQLFNEDEIKNLTECIDDKRGMGIIKDDIKQNQETFKYKMSKMLDNKLNGIEVNRAIEPKLAELLDMDILIGGEKNISLLADFILGDPMKWIEILDMLYSSIEMKPPHAKSVLEGIQSEENYHENLRKIRDKQSNLYGEKKIGEPRELTVKDKRKVYRYNKG